MMSKDFESSEGKFWTDSLSGNDWLKPERDIKGNQEITR